MIRKLRLRFILAALVSILFVLAATIASINVFNYIKIDNETAQSLKKNNNAGLKKNNSSNLLYHLDSFGNQATSFIKEEKRSMNNSLWLLLMKMEALPGKTIATMQ